MKRTLVSMFVLVAILAGLFGVAAPVQAGIMTAAPIFTDAGQTVVLNVSVSTQGTEQFIGWQMDVRYNPAVVRLNSWTEDTSWFKAYATSVGGDTFRVAGTINNTTGVLANAAVAGLAFPAGQGVTGTGVIANLSFTALANGRSDIIFENVCLVLPNNTCATGNTLTPSFIQVGPAPRLAVTGISFTPTGAQGAQFSAAVTVANQAAAAYAGGGTMTYSITNATGGVPASPITVPAIPANGSTVINITGFQLNAGAQNAVLTATIAAFGSSANATYSPVSSSGQTPVDATFGAFLLITPPTAVNFGSLVLGNNTAAGNLNVKCNTNYQVDLFDATNGFYLTEWNGTTYGARKLSNALRAQANGRTEIVTAGSPAKLLDGGVAGQNGDGGQDFTITFSQVLRYSDPLLPAGSTYRTVLTFNAYVTL